MRWKNIGYVGDDAGVTDSVALLWMWWERHSVNVNTNVESEPKERKEKFVSKHSLSYGRNCMTVPLHTFSSWLSACKMCYTMHNWMPLLVSCMKFYYISEMCIYTYSNITSQIQRTRGLHHCATVNVAVLLFRFSVSPCSNFDCNASAKRMANSAYVLLWNAQHQMLVSRFQSKKKQQQKLTHSHIFAMILQLNHMLYFKCHMIIASLPFKLYPRIIKRLKLEIFHTFPFFVLCQFQDGI